MNQNMKDLLNKARLLQDNNLKSLEDLFNNKKEDKGGFFDLSLQDMRCDSTEHEMPGGICIPKGKGYRHTCPKCGKVQIVVPQQVSL